MKGKSLCILLLIVAIACALVAVSIFGVGNVPQNSTEAGDEVQFEIVTDEQGEPVTDENGQFRVEPVKQSDNSVELDGESVTDENGEVVETASSDVLEDASSDALEDASSEVVEDASSDANEDASSDVLEDETTDEAALPRIGYGGYKMIKQGLDLKGGVYIVYEANTEDVPTSEEMSAAVSMLQQRVEYKGYFDAEVSQEGNRRIRVEIPGVDDAAEVVEEIGEAAHLTFREVSDEGLPGAILVDGTNVKDATKAMQQGQIVVVIEFDEQGKNDFAMGTRANVGKRIGIYMDDMLISAPTVQQEINDGSAIITGQSTAEEAEDLAAKIRAGSLPFSLNALEYSSVGARLGADSLSTSVKAGAIGIIIVLLFMLVRYRLPGLAADLALVIYTAMMLIILSLFGLTLTLPGVAGIILGVGMAVDANVIIFERMKEEINAGKTVNTAIKNGFNKALSAIIDCNITTLIASFVLLWLGTGPIKGFAQTLILGILVSMFTALFVTRMILTALTGAGITNRKLFGGK